MAKRRKRRKWSDDEKRMICAQTVVPGVSVAQVARRYDLNANQIFNWLKDPKFAPDTQAAEDEAKFLPVEVIAEPSRPEAIPDASGLIELELASGHRLRISGNYDPDAIARLVQHLT
ncbi:transposase [uncultured Tateyamaria sp.]|uniref:IS66-like element accessory protein TnpA n=1 Tax=uncultured Tateyamaria sp. TaxID=455651 RepID=UPI002625A88B|nr:transposase [uncultured Tateyamaria sp.]